MNVRYFKGDITALTAKEADVIVNAANPGLLGGGGVDGSIHRRAGLKLKMFCQTLPQVSPNVRCPMGNVVFTPAFDLPFKGIIHTVGPIFPDGRKPERSGEPKSENPENDLENTLTNVFYLAWVLGMKKVALPAISCGVYGCTIPIFAEALHFVLEGDANFDEVLVPLFTDEEYEQFDAAWKKLIKE